MSSYTTPSRTAAYYRPTQAQRPDVRDDYERWYTEATPNNRMVLSLRCGIHSEIGWALDRLCRLAHNEQFQLNSLPGLVDALFVWPEWYASEGHKASTDARLLFSADPEQTRSRRFALESLFVLRNASLNDQNVRLLESHPRTLLFILSALNSLDFQKDENIEFLAYTIDILLPLTPTLVITPQTNPIPALVRIASESSNRAFLITSLTTLSHILSHPANASALNTSSLALEAAIRYLPLLADKSLIDACLNYLYAHLSINHMSKAFLLHPKMPSILKLLVTLLITEQVEEEVVLDVTAALRTVPSSTQVTRDHDLTREEMITLLQLQEPERCYAWMRMMFVSRPEGEVTQVDFWNLYKDTFSPHPDKGPLLVASDVIKNVSSVFPAAQAMVLQDPVQRFIVRGVDRRKDIINEDFRCNWSRGTCSTNTFESVGDLYDHLLTHIDVAQGTDSICLWSTCPVTSLPKYALRSHVLTHLAIHQSVKQHPTQSDVISLAAHDSIFPNPNPTVRPIPPPRNTAIVYSQPTIDPPSTSLAALLCIRILFRTAFASVEVAPRADADHFGFPGVVEEMDEEEVAEQAIGDVDALDKEGERRGRKAFVGVRRLMEGVKLANDVLMSWIVEMTDAGVSGTTS